MEESMSRSARLPIVLLATAALAGCAGMGVTLVKVQSFEARPQRMDAATAFTSVTTALVEHGFDIKNSNRDAGLVTTEYQKFASEGDNPPFDYYLQIRTTIQRGNDGNVLVRMTPVVKEQNRMNAAAFTEHELSYYTGEPGSLRLIGSMRPSGWRSRGQTLFMNVVTSVAQALGVSVDEIHRNVTETPQNALLANEDEE
jgi:hypothetical protein